ncbi:exocyst complex component 2-like isoform X2 [Ptychodera flava]|uniref:exocyst complex component 2-like isoform X2 n=1 Tax=Ptychodera flava TaxID=63121 RepID=UPI00396A4A59
MKRNREPPKVTGLSPKEGPPGTKVTIRGENLGINARDLIGLTICGVNCLLSSEWISPSKIICRTGPVKGKGDVIVQTKSAGIGTSTVTFTGFFVQVGPLQESAIWIDEGHVADSRLSSVHRPSSPTLSEDDNPLGLADDGTRLTSADGEIAELFPEGSGDIAAKDFIPARFLLENHQGTSFEDLKAGLSYLKKTSAQRSEGPLAFMKENVSAFMDCQESLTAMHSRLVEDDVLGSPSICQTLQDNLEECNKNAGVLFEDVLNRKDKADSTRNALNVLHRFKFLFNLPINMERNIKKGDYEIVVNDYGRAKSLFSNTEVQVFKKVFTEVESRVAKLRNQLKEQLKDLPATLEDQKKIIRYLVDLESGGDPAWDCIKHQQQWLMNLLTQCKDEYIQGDKLTSPHRVAFLEDLVDIIQERLPEFWKLGQAYCTGELYADSGMKMAQTDTKKTEVFRKMMCDVAKHFAYLLRAAFLPQTLVKLPEIPRKKLGIWKLESTQDSGSAWLPHCVRIMRTLLSIFTNIDMPSDAVQHIQAFTLAMRSHCMTSLFQQASEDIKALHRRENWCLQVDENNGITTLPLLFENIVMETIQLLKEVVVEWKAGEANIFRDPGVQKSTGRLSIDMLKSFATCLEQLTFKTDVEADSQENLYGYIDNTNTTENLLTMEQRLIIVLANCNYVANQVIPRLREHFEKNGYPDTKRVETVVQAAFSELDDKLFDAYTEQKSDPVVGLLEQGLYAGYFDWKTLQRPMGVRPYIKEAIMNLISIHAEVYAISPMFIGRIMTKIVEALAEEICRLMSCVTTGFSSAGALQARIELQALKQAVMNYSNAASNSSFEEALKLIPQVNGSNKKILEEELNNFKSNMRLQLLCFQGDGSGE